MPLSLLKIYLQKVMINELLGNNIRVSKVLVPALIIAICQNEHPYCIIINYYMLSLTDIT